MSEKYILNAEYKHVVPKNEAVDNCEDIKNAERDWWHDYYSPSSPMTPCHHTDSYSRIF